MKRPFPIMNRSGLRSRPRARFSERVTSLSLVHGCVRVLVVKSEHDGAIARATSNRRIGETFELGVRGGF